MKKRITGLLLLALCCHVLTANAQFVKTFKHYIDGNFASLSPADIVNEGNTTVTICYNSDAIVMRRLDFSGNILLEEVHKMTDYIPTRMVKTDNDEYIAVGHIGRDDKMFAIRFDNSFNILWSAIYTDGTGYRVNLITHFRETVNIVQVDGVPDEYIIVGTGGSGVPPDPNNPGYLYEFSAISALKIFGSNGNVIWDRKYFSPLATLPYVPPTIGSIRSRIESPSALAYGDNKYFIGGVGLSQYYTGPGSVLKDSFTNFVMSIDRNGTIIDDYKEFVVPATIPSGNDPSWYGYHDAIFDAQTQQFVMSFAIQSYKRNGVRKTEIGLAKFTNYLGLADFKYYFDPNIDENFPFRVKETYANDGYIVACGINGLPLNNALGLAMLKVDKGGTVQFYNRYNQNTGYYSNNIISILQNTPAITPIFDVSGTENYAISFGAVRIASTDVNGETCGFRPNSTQQDGNDLVIQMPVTYQPANHITESAGSYTSATLLTTITDCEDAPDPDYYKTTGVPAIVTNTVRVYPTILEPGNNTVMIETYVDAATDIMISVSSIDGRTIETKRNVSGKGSSTITYTLPASVPGIYLLRLSSDKGGLNRTFKIYKQ